jgi:hypothetical protein
MTSFVSTAGLNSPRWREKVFSVATRDYVWLDVFLAAMLRGDWQPFERRLVEGQACLAEAERRDAWPDSKRLEEAATAFRYDRDLLTTDETIAWLDRSGLSLDDWTDFLMRGLLRDEWSDQIGVLVETHAPKARADGAFLAEGICSDVFDQWLKTLAGRAAIAAAAPANANVGADHRPRVDETCAAHAEWLVGLDASEVVQRLTRLAEFEAAFVDHAAVSRTPEALALQLARNRLDWMRVDLERLSFDEADAAREAAWCVREDGMTLSEVAIESRMTVRDTRELLERLEPELRDAVLSASVDQLIGPLQVGDRHEVAWVVGKAQAELTDPLVRARAEESALEQLVSKAILSHVRWVERPRL